MLTYTFTFKDGETVVGSRQMRVTDKAALVSLIEKAAAWQKDKRRCFVYGPGMRTACCGRYLVQKLQAGRVPVPLK
jgi:DNA-binding MurR/RpiR family transcriptional regulator